MPGEKLTENRIKFCEEWLIHGNGTLAYKTAYPHVKNDNIAGVSSYHLLRNPKIQAYLDARKAEMAAKLEITPEKVLQSYARRAFFDPRQLLDPETGKLIPLHRLPRDVAACVTKIKVRSLKPKTVVDEDTGNKTEVEQNIIEVEWDKGDAARESLSKVLGLYEKDHKQQNEGLMTAEQFVRAIRSEVDGSSLGLPGDKGKDD
ncbi:terminase small subunit [Desulfobacter sp.]|uniref:terminase small subunit n=1 Tax=Desulfobacter sp. TaxID=2294 RepID=UPI003D0D3593